MPTCQALVVTCFDFRFQKTFVDWLDANVGHGNYDRVGLAGGVKNWAAIAEQVDLAKRLHDIRQVILINHENCMAYGEAGTYEKHCADLRQARAEILKKYPDVQVDLYYAHLPGEHGGELVEVT